MNGGGSSAGLWNARGFCYTTFKGAVHYFHVTNKAYYLPGKDLGVICYFHKTVTVEQKYKEIEKIGMCFNGPHNYKHFFSKEKKSHN